MRENKSYPLSIRLTENDRKIIARVAEMQGMQISFFIKHAALNMAENILETTNTTTRYIDEPQRHAIYCSLLSISNTIQNSNIEKTRRNSVNSEVKKIWDILDT